MSDHAVTIYVRVYDKADLFKAAIERSVQDGLPDWKPEDISDALRMLFDPGMSPPGVEILDSSCEGDPDSDDEDEEESNDE